jgi:nitroimidazol reductase NimA-like FMN-containing flavoprotein (pyridoxamine 5'-phosphate oxidase superfamily)
MLIERMSDRECRELLARTNIARLACSFNNQPYVVPIHVDYYDGYIYGFSTIGQKIEWMRANPLVCVEVDELTTRRDWESLVVFGEYEELTDVPEHAFARSDAESLFQRHANWWEPATVPLTGHQLRGPILFRILIRRMTGRRARSAPDEAVDASNATPEKRHLRWLRNVMRRLTND